MLTTLQSYQSPTRLVQGLGAIRELGREAERLGVKRPLVVTDRGIAAAGLLETALQRMIQEVPHDPRARFAGIAPRAAAPNGSFTSAPLPIASIASPCSSGGSLKRC